MADFETREVYKYIEDKLTRSEVVSMMYALQENYNIKIEVKNPVNKINDRTTYIFK